MIVMKQISTILNVVLLAAVGYLYYYNFSGKKSTAATADKKTGGEKNAASTGIPHGNIAYIEIDSLHENYLYYKSLKDELERRQKTGTQALEEKQKRFQARAGQLQQRAQSMTPQEQEAAGKEMDNMQQELARGKQDLDNQLFELSNNMKTNVLKNVQNFLLEFNKDKKYDYILSYEPGFMFYKDSTLNITSDVINGLNEMDKKKKQ
jgi:outer membrane protein